MTDKIVLTEEGGKLVLVSEDKTETLVLKEYGVIKETPVAAGMDDLFDVDTSGKDDDDILVWNASEGLWKAAGQGEATNLVTSVHGRIGDVVAEEADYALYYATFAQGIVADTALQPGDNVSELTNDAGYITLAEVPPGGVTSVDGRTGDVTLSDLYAPLSHTHAMTDITDSTWISDITAEPIDDLSNVDTAGLLGGHHLEYDAETMSWKPVFGGLTALGIMRFEYRMANPLTNTTPSGGRVGLNNTDPTLVTEMYFHKDSINGNDLTFFFDEMVAGDWVNIYEENNFDRSQRYDLTGPAVLTGEVYTLPVVFYSTDGAPLTANERVNVLWRIGGSIDYLEKVADDTAPALGGDLQVGNNKLVAGTNDNFTFDTDGLAVGTDFLTITGGSAGVDFLKAQFNGTDLIWDFAPSGLGYLRSVTPPTNGSANDFDIPNVKWCNDNLVTNPYHVDVDGAGNHLFNAVISWDNQENQILTIGTELSILSAVDTIAFYTGGGSQTLRYPLVDGGQNQILKTDGTGNITFGEVFWNEIPDKPTEFTPEAHTHVEDEITDLDRVRWRGRWTDTEYLKNDQVLDFPYLGVANKATTDRVAPETLGAATWFHDDADGYPPWVNEAQAAVIHSGFDVVFNEAVELNRVRIAIAEISDTTNYRVAVITDPDGANPVVNMINDPILVEDDWVTVAVGMGLILAGTKVRFLIDALDSSASTNWTGGWRNDGTDITAGPSTQGFNRRSQNNVLRIDKTDLDSVDRTTDLTGITPGSTVRIFETTTPSNFLEYNVSETPVDQGTYLEYMVSLEDSSGIISTSATCTIDVSVPIPNTTDYLKIDDYWATNQPVWGDVTGFLRIDGVEQAGVENTCFGIDLLVQRLSVSDDWDVTAISAGSTTTGSLSVPEAPVDSSVYGRKDAAWTPVVETLVEVGGYSEDVTVLDAIDASLNNFATASGNPITITNVPTGAYTISIVCPSGGSNSIFSGLSVKWAGALSPTWTTDEDIVFLMTTDQGTTWYGSASLGHA